MLRSFKERAKAMFRALTARSAPPPSAAHNRARLTLEGLEVRDVPATWWVTNGNDSGSGSLRQAYIDAENAGNSQNIIIDDTVSVIGLNSPIETGTMACTAIDIITENNVAVTISANTPHTYRFFDGQTPNGSTLYMENLIIEDFGADLVVVGGITVDNGDGGAIRMVGSLSMVNCEFINNMADATAGRSNRPTS